MTTVEEVESFFAHYGIPGMRWGVRKRDKPVNPERLTKEEVQKARANLKPVRDELMDRTFDAQWRRISDQQYSELSTKSVTFKKGHEFYRVEEAKYADKPAREIMYVSTNQGDRLRYRGLMPDLALWGGKKFGKHNEVTMKALVDLKSPSEKERVDAFIKILDEPSVKVGRKMVPGKQVLKAAGYGPLIGKIDSQKAGQEAYRKYMSEIVYQDSAMTTAYLTEIRKRGYNALIDDNDALRISNEPLILLDPNGTVKRVSVEPLTDRQINQAQQNWTVSDTKMVKPPPKPPKPKKGG